MNHLGYLETFAQVGPKKQEYSRETIVPILRIRGAPICQKLGMILENKVVQKLKLEKNGLLNWYSEMIFFFFFEKNPLIFDIENWLWKYDFGTFDKP